jgi:hypothetical protein
MWNQEPPAVPHEEKERWKKDGKKMEKRWKKEKKRKEKEKEKGSTQPGLLAAQDGSGWHQARVNLLCFCGTNR